MGLLTGSKTPTIFDAMTPQQPSALSKIHGMLGGSQNYATAPVAAPTPAPVQSGARPGNLGGGPTPMRSASPAVAGSAQQPEPVPSQPDLNQLLAMLASMFGGQQQQVPLNWLQQQRNPNGTPFQSQAGRPETLSDFYGPHGISPTATAATAASPINYLGLFGASDPYWGSNAMPGRFPTTQSPMMQMESALKGTPYEQYAFEPYMDRIRTPTDWSGGNGSAPDVETIMAEIAKALYYPAQSGGDYYDQDLMAGG